MKKGHSETTKVLCNLIFFLLHVSSHSPTLLLEIYITLNRPLEDKKLVTFIAAFFCNVHL